MDRIPAPVAIRSVRSVNVWVILFVSLAFSVFILEFAEFAPMQERQSPSLSKKIAKQKEARVRVAMPW
jgi:hypothetical protein